MAAETTYFVVEYNTLAGGSFTALTDTLLTWVTGSGSAFIVTAIENADGLTGKLICALYAGAIPTSTETMTQGAVSADCGGPANNGDGETLLYPAYARPDFTYAVSGAIVWAGLALGATHSFRFDGQTANFVVGEILTFTTGGQTCEVVTVISDVGVSGEVAVRWITNLDTGLFPDDNDAFTGDITGDGVLNGLVHPRCYSPLNLHRLLGDLMDDAGPESDDFLSIIDPTASARSTDQIIQLLGAVTITDECAQHMSGGSVSQASGNTLYSGLALNITDAAGDSNPIVIKDDAIVTAYWENAFMPNSISGRVRILIKTRVDGVDIDEKRVIGKLLEYGDSYFTGSTVLGTGETGLALFSTADGNNQTAAGTVAGAPYNTIIVTEGYQTIDYNNGNGAQPYVGEVDFGSATSAQTWERLKYIQRRGTAETLASRNAQLYTGVTLNMDYDTELLGPFVEDETLAWGSQLPYTPLATATQVWQYDDSITTFVDMTTEFNNATAANLIPFPATEAIEDYFAIGFGQPVARFVFDNAGGTQGVGGVVAWEYYDGTAWVAVAGLSDGTSGFTTAVADGQVVTFTVPTDWEKVTLNAVEAYYLRARITTVYSTNPIYDQGFLGGDTFAIGEVVANAGDTARGRVLFHDATNDILIVSQDAGTTAFTTSEEIAGLTSGIAATLGTVVTNSTSGTAILLGLNDAGADGQLYTQRTRGVAPADGQLVYGQTSLANAAVDILVESRVIGGQCFFGTYTGAAYNPGNFGWGIDATDAIASDNFTDLLGVTQVPPNNQTGIVTGLAIGDRVAVYPWDGSTLDINGDPLPTFAEATLTTALVSGVTTSAIVTAIPVNTPNAGLLRIERDSDNQYDLVPYTSYATLTYTLTGTAPSAAAIGNNVMRAFIDQVATATSESYTAVQTGTNQVTIINRRGGVNPIKTFKGSATFGTAGFSSGVQRITDA
jgi:hypothetical protein